jgi:hypothetical protein
VVPQPADQREDFCERLPPNCHLGHLQGDIAAVDDDLGADFDQLVARWRVCLIGTLV